MILAIICIVIICLALAFFERFLANLKGRIPGLVLPYFFGFTSIFSILTAVWQVLLDLTKYGTPIQIILMFAVMLVALNVPTLITYAVYVLCRRKKGETPWPLRAKPESAPAPEDKHPD
ncbi:MAG: hypothetical protein ACI3XY_03935 [Butyricicoccaceae bacterium]